MKNDGGPAFPIAYEHHLDARASGGLTYKEWQGMSLRDYFAAAALQGYGQNMLVMNNAIEGWDKTGRGGKRKECIAEYLAGLAYEVADAMLAERERS